MQKIKLGICDWAIPGGGTQSVQIAASYGLEAVALNFIKYHDGYPFTYEKIQNIYLDLQDRYDMTYCAFGLNDLSIIPIHARKTEKEYGIVRDMFEKCIRAALVLGVSAIQVPNFSASEIKNEEDMEYAAAALQHLCDLAQNHNIVVGAENLLDADAFRLLHRSVDRDNFGLYYDSQNYHVFRGIDQGVLLDELYEYLLPQLHLKDGCGTMSGALLGNGAAGFWKTVDYLKNAKFSGYLLLENYYDQLPLLSEGDPFSLMNKDVALLKQAREIILNNAQ